MQTMQQVIRRLSFAVDGARSDWQSHLPLDQADPFFHELEVMFGESGGRGLVLRIGRAAFRNGLKRLGHQAGFHAAEFRLLPAPRRLEEGLRVLAGVIGKACDSIITVSDEGAHWLWRVDRRSNGSLSQAGGACYLIAGLLQEFTSWAGGGRVYRVVETKCRGFGSPACIYRIDKKPLD